MSWLTWVLGITTATIAPIAISFLKFRYSRPKSLFHSSFSSQFYQWFLYEFLYWYGKYYVQCKFPSIAKDAILCNEKILQHMLQHNAQSLFGQQHSFGSIKTKEQFKQLIPLSTYDQYESYVEKALQGVPNVLTCDKVVLMGYSSGTSSGKKKIIPVTQQQRLHYFLDAIPAFFFSFFQQTNAFGLQKSLKLMVEPKWDIAPCGLKIGPASSVPSISQSQMPTLVSPKEVYFLQDEPGDSFLHLLFALLDRNLGHIECNFITSVSNLFYKLEMEWRQLVQVIRTGQLPENFFKNPATSSQTKQIIQTLLQQHANSARATEIEQVMLRAEQEKKPFLVTDIWPHMNGIIGVTSGSFSFYAERLQQHLPPQIKIFSPFYACTESLLGVNYDTNKNSYLLHPLIAFYEFIPVEEYNNSNPTTLFLNQLQINKEYELVISSSLGLYRYRLGDVIKVIGFYGTIPEVEFCYRIGCLINRTGEKVSENDFQTAMKETEKVWNVQFCDYTILDDPDANFYHIIVELVSDVKEKELIEQFSSLNTRIVDELLSKYSPIFGSWLKEGKLKGVKISLLKTNTFQQFKQFLMDRFKTYREQLKIARLIRNSEQITFFERSILASKQGDVMQIK